MSPLDWIAQGVGLVATAVALWSFTAGAVASGLYGLFQYFSGMVNTTWTDTALFDDIQLRVYSTFANPNVYGEFLLIALPLVAGFERIMFPTLSTRQSILFSFAHFTRKSRTGPSCLEGRGQRVRE